MKAKIIGFVIFLFAQYTVLGQAAATSSYDTQTGALGTTYSWIDCSSGTTVVSGDDVVASFSWPFTFSYYDNTYSTSDNISVSTNGFIRLDGNASTDWQTASNYNLTSGATNLGQIIAMAVYDGNVNLNNGSWVRYIVSGTSPNRILTVEYNNLKIPYNSNKEVDVQVSFYETLNSIVLKLKDDNITQSGVDMGLHSGVNGYFNKWQEVRSGTNNTWREYTRTEPPPPPPTSSNAAASWNYGIQTGNIGTTYSWIDCTSGSSIVSGDDVQATINWPFNFNFYDNSYNISNTLSLVDNGFIRLDGTSSTSAQIANDYELISNATQLGQIIALAVKDNKVGDNGGWVRSSVTGIAPTRIFTIEYNNLEIDYNDNRYADVQVSFYESINKIVLKLGAENLNKSGVDMGLHSGVDTFFNKWKEVNSGTNNTWIEYTPPYIEVNATAGTSVAYYSTLKNAFDKINDGTHGGNITLKVNHSTSEYSSAVLNPSGSGFANYNSVTMYPTKTGLTISGDLATPLIDLNGADNVTIDGRVNGVGTVKDLSIINYSASSVAGTSTIRFINDANNNTVKYCRIKGSEANANSGVLFFSTTNSTTGNVGNNILNNNITSAFTNNRPINSIYSLGSIGKNNSENIIKSNNIFDFLNKASNSNGIFLSSNTSAWTIDGNSFYETLPFSGTNATTYHGIQISSTAGNDFKIFNNFIGGISNLCGGTAWTKTNATNNIFNAISLNVGTTITSSIQNNTIQNFNWSNSANGDWTGIQIIGGNVDVGTVTGNTIGNDVETDLITVSGANSGLNVYGIYISSSGTVNCQKNSVGSITTNNGAALASNIYGIFKSATAGATTISDNFIGSTTIANSINASSTSTSNAQVVYGIYNAGTGTIALSNNSVSNLKNGTSNTTVGNLGVVQGITSIAGSIILTNNTIYNLSIANANNNTNNNASVCGISLTGTTNTKSIKGNTIYNLSNNYSSFAGSVIGLYYGGSTVGNSSVSENFIHSLSVDSGSLTASIYGIKIGYGSTTFSNNIINLGGITKTTIYGIYETGIAANNNSLYFNSVYIGGSLASGSTNKSYALFSNVSTNTRNIRNNIFMNARSTVGGSNLHYAAYFNYASSSNIVLNYNDYFVSGTGGVLGFWNSANKTVLPIITGQDANSLTSNPTFQTAGGTNFTDYIASASLSGVTGTGIIADYEGITRNNPPKMGALESSLPFVWQGTLSTNFATPGNWQNGAVPTNGADIIFAASPTNDCFLDQARTLRKITNTSSYKFVLNGKQLTLTGSIVSATANQIDATASLSTLVFAGTTAQTIPTGVFLSNTIDGLTVDNSNGLTQNGAIIIEKQLTLTNGAFSIGANTLSINDAITTTSGTLVGGATSNINIGGSGANTLLPSVSVNSLIVNRANGLTLGGNVTVSGNLDLTNGSLTLGGKTLTIATNTINIISGDIVANQTSDTVDFQNTAPYIYPTLLFNGNTIENFTLSGAGGITLNNTITVNGILNLQNSNVSATKGLLHVSFTDNDIYNELIMGVNSTNDGQGDVTGVISRYAFVEGLSYSFGNKNTLATFNPGATTLPVFLKARVTIGTAPPWRTGAVYRTYDLIQFGGDQSIATFRASYLDSELNSNVVDDLSFWTPTDRYGVPPPVDSGRSNYNITENWLELADVNIAFFPPVFGYFPIVMDESGLSYKLWVGEFSTDWNNPLNWFPSGVPILTSAVRIPNATTTNFDPTLPPNATTEIFKLVLDLGSILNSGNTDNAQLTITDNIGTWANKGGIFNPGNSTVNFIRKNEISNAAIEGVTTISGTTTFNNIYISELTTLMLVGDTHIKVAGAITINEVVPNRGILLTASSGKTVVEYNGANQTVAVTDASSSKYSTLILSGTGVKTIPNTALEIVDNFILSGTASATAQSIIIIGNELEIQNGTTFATGNFNHNLGGNFNNSGTFVPNAGTAFTLNGSEVQDIYGATQTSFEKLIINNGAGIEILTNTTVNNELELVNGSLNVGTTDLTINGTITKTSGYLGVNTGSSLTFGGATSLTLPSTLFENPPSFNNLTITRTGGVIAGSDMTINGVLTLQSNPSATIGILDTGSSTLYMETNATTVGLGDVTGIVRREHPFANNIKYSFGNEFTNFTFDDINLKPTWISIKISIGTIPTWGSYTPVGKVKRLYQIARSENSSTSLATINMHYLPSELDVVDNDASKLTFWHKYINFGGGTPHEHGPSNQDFVNHSLQVNGLPLGTTVTEDLSESQVTMAYSLSTKNTWQGSVAGFETEWEQPFNWTAGHVPLITEDVLIPGGLTYYPSLTAAANAVAGTLEIALGASITANSYPMIINGATGAWENRGTFDPGTGKVTFNHGVVTEIVTVAGITNFYDIEVGENTAMQPVAGNLLRIANIGSATMTSLVDFSTINNTVEWNGANQTIVNPNGIDGDSGYFNLILSGSGTKTMPTTAMIVNGDFGVSGTTTVAAANELVIAGNTTIGADATFETGNFNHPIGGNFENNGTFIGTSGGNITLNGTLTQLISGTSTSNFDGLTIDNILNVSIASNVGVNAQLLLNGGNLIVGANTLSINGTISNPSGAIDVDQTSNLNFGGTTALVLDNNLFIIDPVVNNLTINRSGGVTLGNQDMTVNGVLDATSGTFTLLDNSLTFSGSSPIRTSGNIDASDSNAALIFTNTSSILLPGSLFIGNINNFTVNGTGGVISNDDLAVAGILNLQSSNPTSIIGSLDMALSSILHMGEFATTIGAGDVTGIVQRLHTFLNGVEYSFGNQFTSLNFLNIPDKTKPTWVKCKITIGAEPSWRNQAIRRYYSFAQAGGTDRMIVKLHYLDTELNTNSNLPYEPDESRLVFWDAYNPDNVTPNSFTYNYPRSYNDKNGNDNWVQLSGPAINYIATSNVLDVKQWGLSYGYHDEIDHLHTWTGNGSQTYDGDWSLPGNWNGGVPVSICPVLIPHPSTLPVDNNGDEFPYRNLLPILIPAHVRTLEISAGATLSAVDDPYKDLAEINSPDYDITVYGSTNAWVNNGTFIPGTAKVIFAHGDPDVEVTLDGTTNFYDVEVNDKTLIQPATGSIIRIENAFSFVSGSIFDFSTNSNSIDYNGTDQVVVNPLGGITPGYSNLLLSGNGVKTLPNASFQIFENFELTQNASTLVKSDLIVGADLNLSQTSKLSVAADKTLTVNGAINNAVGIDGFILESTAVGTASLIHDTDNVPATVERYINGAVEAWHFLSSPVSNQTIAGSNLTPAGGYGNGTGYDLYVWDEPTPCWVYHKNVGGVLPYDPTNPDWPHVHAQSDFIPGRGYLYSVEALNPTKEFIGNLNNGSISYLVTATSTVDPLLKGFNLIGNPYPSSINWEASSGWTRTNLLDSGGGYDMWIWNPAASNYGTYNSATSIGTNSVTQYIAPMQGFFVRAESSANIVMNNNIRLHTGASNWMKSTNSNYKISTIKVQIASNSGFGFDEVLLQFGHSSNEPGAAKLFSTTKTAPSMYLKVGNEELSVRYLTDTINNPFVPILFKPGIDGNYSLNIDIDFSDFEYVFLEDIKTKTFHNLLDKPTYQFKSSQNDDINRFVLHFTPKEYTTEEDLSALIYYNGNDIIVDLTLVPEQTEVVIYDMIGKRVLNKNLQGQTIHKLLVTSKSQLYIVVAKSENKTVIKKVLVY